MPPCAPSQYPRTRQHTSISPATNSSTLPRSRRVIFPTLPLYKGTSVLSSTSRISESNSNSVNDQPEMTDTSLEKSYNNKPTTSTPKFVLPLPLPLPLPSIILPRHPAAAATRSSKLQQQRIEKEDETPVKTLHRPPLQSLEIPEDTATRARSTTGRRSVLSRYQLTVPTNLFSTTNTSKEEEVPQSQSPKAAVSVGAKLVSILRASSFGSSSATTAGTDNISNNNSKAHTSRSVPSLKSLHGCEYGTSSSQSSLETAASSPSAVAASQPQMRRSCSEPGSGGRNHSIQFDPRIWIREFQRSEEEHDCTWYNDDDMDRFKRHALALVMARDQMIADSTNILPTGTTRTIRTKNNNKNGKANSTTTRPAFFTHAALTLDGETTSPTSTASYAASDVLREALQSDRYRAVVAQQKIRRILLVDPHDICVTLFRKAFTTLLPKVEIVAATSATQALECIANTQESFDILVVEERLQPLFHQHANNNNSTIASSLSSSSEQQSTTSIAQSSSGSGLFRSLASIQNKKDRHCRSAALWIGVSAHLTKDRTSLEAAGADLCWGKPPPKMSDDLRNQLLQLLLSKRGQSEIVQELFGETTTTTGTTISL
jgi:hypothetical protein